MLLQRNELKSSTADAVSSVSTQTLPVHMLQKLTWMQISAQFIETTPSLIKLLKPVKTLRTSPERRDPKVLIGWQSSFINNNWNKVGFFMTKTGGAVLNESGPCCLFEIQTRLITNERKTWSSFIKSGMSYTCSGSKQVRFVIQVLFTGCLLHACRVNGFFSPCLFLMQIAAV